jgi:uncharacterized membrane protein YhaH (DUF805 family)
MTIHLAQNGQQMGQFSREQVEGMIRSGLINYTTLAWTEGKPAWMPLRDIIGAPVPPPPPPAAPISRDIHPFLSYFVPVGRIGRCAYFLRNLTYFLLLVATAGPLLSSQGDEANIWGFLLVLLWFYVITVNVGKRFHDLNVSAWFSFTWPFLPVGLCLLVLSGTKGPNKYGPR